MGAHPARTPPRRWTLVFAANIVGTLLLSAFATGTEAFSPPLRAAFVELGTTAARSGFTTKLPHGVLAGWLIALGKFAHVIAGSVELSFAAMSGEIGSDRYAFGFLLPSLIGNVLGVVGMVALNHHAQVRQDQ